MQFLRPPSSARWLTWLLPFLLSSAPQEAKTVIVPKVIGLTVPQAEATLADAGLKLAEVKEVPSKFPRGIVMGAGAGATRDCC